MQHISDAETEPLSDVLCRCLMFYAGISDETLLPDVDFAQAFTSFLLTHGMSQDQIDALVSALTTNHLLQRR